MYSVLLSGELLARLEGMARNIQVFLYFRIVYPLQIMVQELAKGCLCFLLPDCLKQYRNPGWQNIIKDDPSCLL